MPYGTGRVKKVNLSINPELFEKYKEKCQEMGMSPSENFELWMKALVDSEGMMKTFDSVFAALVSAEVKRTKEK